MSYYVRHRWGDMQDEPPLESLSALYDELEFEDEEHVSVSLTHESDWDLGAYGGGLLIWENLETEENEARHMKDLTKQKVLELWEKLAHGRIDEIEKEPWLPGYGS